MSAPSAAEQPIPLSFSERLVSAVLRRLPVRHGKHRVLDRAFPRPRSRPDRRRRVPFDGSVLSLDVDNLVGWHFAILRDFDPEVAEVLVAAADPTGRDVFWDVGANQGTCSYAVAAALPRASIVAIEPQAARAPDLVANLGQVADGRFEVHSVGIGTEQAVLDLTVPAGNDGAATLHPDARGVSGRVEQVTITTAEDVSATSAYGWPTLVKIDVEGHEPLVVASCLPALRSKHCRVVVFENHVGEVDAFDRIRAVAEECGYDVYAITKTPLRTRLVPTATPVAGATDYALVLHSVTTTPSLSRLVATT